MCLHTDKNPPLPWHAALPPRSLRQLMTVIALSGLAMAAIAPGNGRRSSAPRPRFAPPPRAWNVPAPVVPYQVQVNDRFVIQAPASIDPGMVVAAPQGIDDRMIVSHDRSPAMPSPRPPMDGYYPVLPTPSP